jgi:hypothetical protein
LINLSFQALAVGLRSVLIFVFIFIVTKYSDSSISSSILLEFTYASIFSYIISYGFDYSLVQDKKDSIELKSFFLKIFFGLLMVSIIINIQNLDLKIIFYAISLSCASIFKGLVRLKKMHKSDFIVNLVSLSLLLLFVFIFNISDYLWYLSLSIIIPNLCALFLYVKFYHRNLNYAFKSLFNATPLALYSIIGYLLLNVDVYLFDYLDKVNSYQDFTIPNRFYMNLTMIPVILMNYRISHVFESNKNLLNFFKEFNFIGIFLAVGAFFVADPIIKLISNDSVNLSFFDKLLFSLIIFLRTLNTYFSMIILKKTNNWVRLCVISLTLLFHILLLYFFIFKYDWHGAIYSLTISSLFFLAINFALTKKYL